MADPFMVIGVLGFGRCAVVPNGRKPRFLDFVEQGAIADVERARGAAAVPFVGAKHIEDDAALQGLHGAFGLDAERRVDVGGLEGIEFAGSGFAERGQDMLFTTENDKPFGEVLEFA